MSTNNQQLAAMNERLNQAGYHTIDPEGALAALFNSASDSDSFLKIECLLDCLLDPNTQSNTTDHKDLNGALLCLTDGVLQLNDVEEARRLVRMLFQMCITDSSEKYRRSYYHSFLKKTESANTAHAKASIN
ncbi:MAG: hypothetical protein P1U63_01935 [Coxiellaceae bacterium]|nr:hypothetical protein [Coxiellaceae bacterium]